MLPSGHLSDMEETDSDQEDKRKNNYKWEYTLSRGKTEGNERFPGWCIREGFSEEVMSGQRESGGWGSEGALQSLWF